MQKDYHVFPDRFDIHARKRFTCPLLPSAMTVHTLKYAVLSLRDRGSDSQFQG